MNVTTTADELRRTISGKLTTVRELLTDCDYLCDQMIDLDIWGGQDWNTDFIENVEELQNVIAKFKKASRFI